MADAERTVVCCNGCDDDDDGGGGDESQSKMIHFIEKTKINIFKWRHDERCQFVLNTDALH